MLAQLEEPTNDFQALASYLIHGRETPPNPKRVVWVMGRNIPTDDPVLAAKLMSATAELSRRCTSACLHTIIAWHRDENPTPEVMQEIARRTLDLAGLGEHQALVMGHGDKDHPHLHMMINRVHPETGRAWSTSYSWRRFDRIMRQLSDEHGFRYVPPHSFEPGLTDELPKGPDSRATYAARRGAGTDRWQWSRGMSRRFGAELSESLDRASSWEDLDDLLAGYGLDLEPKGQGLVVGNSASYSKLSALGLTITAKGLQKRFGPRRPVSKRERTGTARSQPRPPTRNIWTVDAIDIARVLGTRADLRHAVQDALRARKARLAKEPLMKQLMEELKEKWKVSTTLRPPRHRPRHRHSILEPRARDCSRN